MKKIAVVLFYILPAFLFAQRSGDVLDIHSVVRGIYVYHAVADTSTHMVPSNGLIIAGKDSVILIDTPENFIQTIRLLNWIITNIKKPIALVIETYAHPVQIGGVPVGLSDTYPVYGSFLTAQEALKNGYRRPDNCFFRDTLFCCDSVRLQTYYPGPAFCKDNQAVYLPDFGILFGGRLLTDGEELMNEKIDSTGRRMWKESLQRLKEKYPHPDLVVPGFGNWDGNSIENTEKLLR
jgi:metallo-beta-lactamase class B